MHLGFRPHEKEIEAALIFVQETERRGLPTKDDAIHLALSTVDQLATILLGKRWSLEIARRPRFLTSDAPLIIWRKPSLRDSFEGVGLENADEVRFPLDSGHQLVLTTEQRPSILRVEPSRVRACNVDTASSCHRFIVGHPNRLRPLEEVPLSAKRPVVRFNTGPGYQKGADGTDQYFGEVLHMWVQRRTASSPVHDGNRRKRSVRRRGR